VVYCPRRPGYSGGAARILTASLERRANRLDRNEQSLSSWVLAVNPRQSILVVSVLTPRRRRLASAADSFAASPGPPETAGARHHAGAGRAVDRRDGPLMAAGTDPPAAEDDPRLEVGSCSGPVSSTRRRPQDLRTVETGPMVGARAAYRFGHSIVWFADSVASRYPRPSWTLPRNSTRTGIEFLFPRARGHGGSRVSREGCSKRTTTRSRGLRPHHGVRWIRPARTLGRRGRSDGKPGREDDRQGRARRPADRERSASRRLVPRAVLPASAVDSDGDGVDDRKDRCPGTPRDRS